MSQDVNYLVLCTDGVMGVDDLKTECHRDKWAAILTYRHKGCPDKIVVAFRDFEIAKKFISRNIPNSWTKGVVCPSEANIEFIKKKGWKIEVFQWEKRLNKKEVEIEASILEFDDHPDIYMHHA